MTTVAAAQFLRAFARRALPVFGAGCVLVFSASSRARGDDLSGADKMRVMWSNQMTWTPEGIPIVTVGVLDGRDEVRVEGAEGVRVIPDGEGGAEVRGGKSWTVRAVLTRPAKIVWHIVVASGRADGAEALQAESARWRTRGFTPHTFETGTVFGLRGEIIDMRRLVVAVEPQDSIVKARARAANLAAEYHVETGLHSEVVERPHGILEARDERNTLVRNDSVLWFAPPIGSTTLGLLDVPREQGGSERRDFAGKLYITIGSDGKLAAANAVPEDRLLAGLLPSEMGANAPPEALKAQAVAARNELLAKLGTRHLTDPYRLCSRVHCQVYAGAGHEDPRADVAIAATRGELLVRPDGSLVDAVYSAACGGHTEDNDKAWGASPDSALRGTLDVAEHDAPALSDFTTITDPEKYLAAKPALAALAACSSAPSFRWTATVDASLVEQKIGAGPITEILVESRGVSGRAVKLKIKTHTAEKQIKGELDIRRLFNNLKSALFIFTVDRAANGDIKTIHFQGAGHGHGVGMCQSGAAHLALTSNYRQILSHYYKDSTLKRFY